MLTTQLHLSLHLGDDPCSTLLRANLKEMVVQLLIDQFKLPEKYANHACLRLFGSTLIRASSANFPFADRKSEDLDLEVYASPSYPPVDSQELFGISLRQIKQILEHANIRVETYDGRSVDAAISYASSGNDLDTLKLKLSLQFPPEVITLLCGRYASQVTSGVSVLEMNISPPRQITVLIPPSPRLDCHVRSSSPWFGYDNILHYLSKVLTRSIQSTHQFQPDPNNPSSFRPTDVMNVFNICFSLNPRLLTFRIPLRPFTNSDHLLDTSEDLLTLRLLILCNLAVFGHSSSSLQSMHFDSFDPNDPMIVDQFGSALASSLGRRDVLAPRKLRIILAGYKRLLEEIFPRDLSTSIGLALFPEEVSFLARARGSIEDDIVINMSTLRGLFHGRYGKIIEKLSPHLEDALNSSHALRQRQARFHEIRQSRW